MVSGIWYLVSDIWYLESGIGIPMVYGKSGISYRGTVSISNELYLVVYRSYLVPQILDLAFSGHPVGSKIQDIMYRMRDVGTASK